jgi:hypothetical protein
VQRATGVFGTLVITLTDPEAMVNFFTTRTLVLPYQCYHMLHVMLFVRIIRHAAFVISCVLQFIEFFSFQIVGTRHIFNK